jgi:hypothetical protein
MRPCAARRHLLQRFANKLGLAGVFGGIGAQKRGNRARKPRKWAVESAPLGVFIISSSIGISIAISIGIGSVQVATPLLGQFLGQFVSFSEQ